MEILSTDDMSVPPYRYEVLPPSLVLEAGSLQAFAYAKSHNYPFTGAQHAM
jgi:hypothetical protein